MEEIYERILNHKMTMDSRTTVRFRLYRALINLIDYEKGFSAKRPIEGTGWKFDLMYIFREEMDAFSIHYEDDKKTEFFAGLFKYVFQINKLKELDHD